MKVKKLKNIRNKKEVISNLVKLVEEDEFNTGNWAIALQKEKLFFFPSEECYVIEENGQIIPAYLICKKDYADILWVAKSYRNKGYARFLINTLGIKYATVIETSVPFWEKLGFKRINLKSYGTITMYR